MITRYTDLEVNLNGLTFYVSGTYTPYEAETPHCPASPAEFELVESRIRVKGQPEADPIAILEAFRGNLSAYNLGLIGTRVRVTWDSGFDQLSEQCLHIALSQDEATEY